MRLPFYYGWVIVAVVFVTMGIGVNVRTAFSLLYPPILDEFGWDRATTAGGFSFGLLLSAMLMPLLGTLMDRRGPRIVIEIGIVLMGSGMLLATQISEPWHLYATLGLLVGAGSVCLGYSGQGLFLPNWFVRRRGFAVSIAFSGVGIGSIVLLPWIQTIIGNGGWRTACFALGSLLLVVGIPLNLLLRKRPEDIGLEPDGGGSAVPGSRPPLRIVDATWVDVDWTLPRAIRTGRFWWIAIAYFGALYAWYAVQVHQTKYLIDVGFGASEAAWALGFVSLAGIPGQIALGHLSDRIGREWIWTVGCLGFALCYVALILLRYVPHPALLYAMITAQGLLGYGLTSVMGAIALEIFQGRQYGAIFGTLNLAALGGAAAGPWVTGLLHDWTGTYETSFLAAAVFSLLSAAAVWLAAPGKVRAVAGRVPRLAREG